MGFVYSEITLKNVNDQIMAKNGNIKDEDVRTVTVNALADTGAYTLVINEDIREKLGLEITGKRHRKLADGKRSLYDTAGPLEICWKDRRFIMEALIIPDGENTLLGALPLEGLDLIVDPVKQELTGAHGEEMLYYV